MKIKVGVLFGGVSVEHEVSIISAVQAMQNMDKNKYEIIPIYMAKDRTWYTGKMLLEIDNVALFNWSFAEKSFFNPLFSIVL